jgi:predicted N-acetyltransferase YhbS
MEIRPYESNDEPHLMWLERNSPRGFPGFVHFRRRFIDRAELYSRPLTLVACEDKEVIAVSSIIVKSTMIGGEPVKIAYSFDTRVAPAHRRKGIGHKLVEEKLKWARAEGAVGVYSLIVATNLPSVGMVEKSGYKKTHLILYLRFQPTPMISMLTGELSCSPIPSDDVKIQTFYGKRDMYTPDLAKKVEKLDFQRWVISDSRGGHAGISVYNQARVYVQIPESAPWPTTEEEIKRLGRNLQLFDVTGFDRPDLLRSLFEFLRDEAVITNTNKLMWLVDRNDKVPRFVFEDAAYQQDYWLMYKSFESGIEPNWHGPVYLDPRDL